MRQCKRCKCTNYFKPVEHNDAGEVVRCSICAQDPMTLARYAHDCFEKAREQMYVQCYDGKVVAPVDTQRRIKASIDAAKLGLRWIGILNASLPK